ncbi:MAG: DUF6115 domain-containing protein [Agathobacter sp.]|nr:DUF6115 domain-containing protein [Agathobacter sp.]
MTEIILIIVGVVFLIGSFFVKDKLSSKDIDKMAQLSEAELKVIVERQLKNADNKVEATLEGIIEESQEVTKRSLEKETNDKIMAISEYSDTVMESMNKTHNEIMFLYSMLNDKHKDLTDLAGELQEFSDSIKNTEMETSKVIESVDEIEQKVQEARPLEQQEFLAASIEKTFSAEKPFSKKSLNSFNNHNAHILRLHGEGVSDVDIAKELGLGLGEVKLVIGLYKGE